MLLDVGPTWWRLRELTVEAPAPASATPPAAPRPIFSHGVASAGGLVCA
jgi:hypothetical protein